MRTQVTISAYTIQVSIAGISIEINRDELFDSIDTVQKFVKNIWPEDRKEDLESMGFNKACDYIARYKPLALRALACYTFEETASSIIIINEDGTIDMKSNEQNAKLDLKALMQVISEFSTMAEEDEKKESKPLVELSIPMGITRQELYDILADAHLLTHDVSRLFQGVVMDNQATDLFISVIAQAGEDLFTIERINESTDQSMDYMADNEIIFHKRPTNPELRDAIANKTGRDISWYEFYTEMQKRSGMFLDKNLWASSHIIEKACDVYGLEAKLEFNAFQ